jgi:hypothetical protein
VKTDGLKHRVRLLWLVAIESLVGEQAHINDPDNVPLLIHHWKCQKLVEDKRLDASITVAVCGMATTRGIITSASRCSSAAVNNRRVGSTPVSRSSELTT